MQIWYRFKDLVPLHMWALMLSITLKVDDVTSVTIHMVSNVHEGSGVKFSVFHTAMSALHYFLNFFLQANF